MAKTHEGGTGKPAAAATAAAGLAPPLELAVDVAVLPSAWAALCYEHAVRLPKQISR